ncbi:MAG: GNAT family N-acetyltransferase [Candidatus Bathyarchaeia archaeon]
MSDKKVIVNVRAVKPNDVDTFINLYIQSYKGLEEYAYTTKRDIRDYFKWLLKRDPDGFLIVELNEPVAFMACDANWFSPFEMKFVGEIHEIFVHPNYRGQGIGSMLIKRAINYAKEREREIMGLWVGVRNTLAREFYKKRGFIETISFGKWMRMIRKI